MTSTSVARRHHYLPQFYLRRFSNESGRVLRTFRGPDDALHEKFLVPRATGFEEDLYTLADWAQLSPKHRPDAIETDVFSPIDHHGASVARRLETVAPSELSSQERAHCALFVNSLLKRHPRRVFEGDRKAERAARELREELRERWGPPPDGRPDVLDLIDVEALARNLHREHIVRTIRDETTLNYLSGLTFVKLTLQPNATVSFVTGDSPVLVNLGQSGPIHFFTLALDPQTLLFGHNDREERLPEAGTLINLCLLHNLSLFAQCQYVFSKQPLEDNELLKTRRQASRQLIQVPWRKT